VLVAAKNAVDYTKTSPTGQEEVCPQRKLNDWTGLDSLLAPTICLLTLLIAQLVVPDTKHPLFTPVPPPEDEAEEDGKTAAPREVASA